MKQPTCIALSALVAVALALGCANANNNADEKADAGKKEAVAMIEPTTTGKAKGTVRFIDQGNGKLRVVARIEGLNPNQKHAMHVHEGTECGPDGMKAGGHYNPEKHEHGLPEQEKRHAGDLGNLQANAKGVAEYEITVDNITIDGQKNPVIGRAVIVHEKPDDGGQPVGNAGGRIGCGIIKMKGDKTASAEEHRH
jgi:Cu-Zn family superoxide dismutase